MNLYRGIFCFLLDSLLLCSCVRRDYEACCYDNPVALDGRVSVAVRDIDYDNAAEVGRTRADDQQPMCNYLSSLIAARHCLETDSFTATDITLDEEALMYELDEELFMTGTNHMLVVGNEDLLADGITSIDMTGQIHPDNTEYKDIYVGAADFSYPNEQDVTIWMLRAKGMLSIEIVNLPADVTGVDVTVENVFAGLDRNFDYSGTTSVSKSFDPAEGTTMEVMLAPTVPGNTSRADGVSPVKIVLKDSEGTTAMPVLPVNIERNRITALRPTYDPETQEWSFQILVDGEWERIEPLVIAS